MQIDITKYKNELLFVILGGANEIGMNLAAYCYQGKWLIVDMGVGFNGDEYPGADVVLPKIKFLEQYQQDVVGLVITHAHEDHIGAVPYLWGKFHCPIYTTKFTAEVLLSKFEEFDIDDRGLVNIIEASKRVYQLEPFSIEMVPITHSIPEMHGVMIRTPVGSAFHTGDYKLDPDPMVGPTTDEERLCELGEEGVLALVSDSTNIFNTGHSKSEGLLHENLKELMQVAGNGMIVVTTFASNIQRIDSLSKAGRALGRKTVLCGRSLWRLYHAAVKAGYFTDTEAFIEPSAAKDMKRNELLVICTGCQGEEAAAMSRIAHGTHPDVQITSGDLVIFSSKIIPGNERAIYRIFDTLARIGVDVMSDEDYFVHVSGHPAQKEVERMYKMLRPKIAIPVHGQAVHLRAHCKKALEFGAQYAVEVENGSLVQLTGEGAPYKLGKVESGYLVVDGFYVIDEHNPIIRERKALKQNGVLFVSLLLSANENKLARRPRLLSYGIFDRATDKELYDKLAKEVRAICVEKTDLDERGLIRNVSNMLGRTIRRERGKEAVILVSIDKI